MTAAAEVAMDGSATRPGLVFFYSAVSGRCRRVESLLAQVLQRRRNHETFRMYRVGSEQHPELVERCGVTAVPTLVVVEGKKVQARLEAPRGSPQIERFLSPWLR